MRAVWSNAALDEFAQMIAYIAGDDPLAARRVADRIRETVDQLADRPIGRRGRVPGTYEKVVTGLPYIVAYALVDDQAHGETLAVLHVIHGAMDWPEGRWPPSLRMS